MNQLELNFRNSATRRGELLELMHQPAFVDALAIVKEKSYEPKPMPVGYDIVQWGAVVGWKREGYLECLANLLSLVELSVHKMPDRKPWDAPDKAQREAAALQELEAEMSPKAGPTAPKPDTAPPQPEPQPTT